MNDLFSFSSPFPIFTAGLAIGALAIAVWQRGRVVRLVERLRQAEARADDASAARAEAEALRVTVASLEAHRQADAERLAWIHTADEQLQDRFRAMAGDLLDHASRTLAERSDTQLRAAIEPLDRTLSALGTEVRALETAREGAYASLRTELGQLHDAQRALHTSAEGLASALRTPTVRGQWGEVQLRRLVEMAGLAERVDFTEQPTAEGGLRPDMIIHLPGGGVLPIDAKAPLDAFLSASETLDPKTRRTHLDRHVRALKRRINELGQRAYWQRFDETPELVVLFVPNDASLSSAFARDPNLFDFAFGLQVLLASPVTLLALLKTVAHGWQQHRLAGHAKEVADLGRTLYGQLGTFLDQLGGLGLRLDQAVQTYNQTLGTLERRILPSARQLAEAGVGDRTLPEGRRVERTIRTAAPPAAQATPSASSRER